MDLKAVFATDRRKETEGVWFPVSDSELLIARYNNINFERILAKRLKLIRPALATGATEDDERDDKIVQTIAETVLLGWRNVSDEGRQLAYSTDNAYKMLKKYPDFRRLVEGYALDADNFREAAEASIEKNSETSSPGN